jgi:glutamate formiminotransferase
VPLQALVEAARYYLRLHDFDDEQILELKLISDAE